MSSHPNYEILMIFQHAVHEKTEKKYLSHLVVFSQNLLQCYLQ